jgi:hypothetical protein
MYIVGVRIEPGEDGATVALVFSSATGLQMSFPIRLNGVLLGAFLTFPFFLTMFSAEMLLNPGKIA